MKHFLTILFFVVAANALAQNKVITKYYDSLWQPVAQEKASFYSEFKPTGSLYRMTSYYYPSMKLYGKSTWLDTLFEKGIGLIVRYYENGKIKDSGCFFDESKRNYSFSYKYYESGALQDSTYTVGDGTYYHYHYSEGGKLSGYSTYNILTKQFESIGYDDHGRVIPNYIFERPAQFSKGGIEGWMNYLTQHLRHNLPVRKGAPVGKYVVIVEFDVDVDGNVMNVFANNNPGYGTKEEAIRVVNDSPQWIPAISFNKPVTVHHRQSITFKID